MRTLFVISLFYIAALASTGATDFVWRTESMTAKIQRDDKLLKMGQYLQLQQELRPREQGWTTMKLDLPETWTIERVSVAEGVVQVHTSSAGTYTLTRDNVGKLSFDILDGGHKIDAALEALWRKHALQPKA